MKIKDGARYVWDLLAEGYWRTVKFVEDHPHWVLWAAFAYVAIRR